jgi:uncharacterized protein (TIGR02001 family)
MHRKSFIKRGFSNVPGDMFRVVVMLLFLAATNTVNAQVSGSATLVSDYRYRGVSLSQGMPEAQVDIGYDSPSGWYAGMLGSGVRLNDIRNGVNTEQFVAYAGYAGKILSGLNWEVGASDERFIGNSAYDYLEEFVGLTSDHFNARIYFSPSYFDQDVRTVYAELNAAYSLQDHVQLLAHAGLLHPLEAANGFPSASASRYDGRIGVNAPFDNWNFQLAWVTLQKKTTLYPHYDDRNPHAVVLSISYSF